VRLQAGVYFLVNYLMNCNCVCCDVQKSCRTYLRLTRILGISASDDMQKAQNRLDANKKKPGKKRTIALEPAWVSAVKRLRGKGYHIRCSDKKVVKVKSWKDVFGDSNDYLDHKKTVDECSRFVDAGGDSSVVWEVARNSSTALTGCDGDTCSGGRTSLVHLCPFPGYLKHLHDEREGCVVNSFFLLLPHELKKNVNLCNRFISSSPLNNDVKIGLRDVVKAGSVRFGITSRKKNVNIETVSDRNYGTHLAHSDVHTHCVAIDKNENTTMDPGRGVYIRTQNCSLEKLLSEQCFNTETLSNVGIRFVEIVFPKKGKLRYRA